MKSFLYLIFFLSMPLGAQKISFESTENAGMNSRERIDINEQRVIFLKKNTENLKGESDNFQKKMSVSLSEINNKLETLVKKIDGLNNEIQAQKFELEKYKKEVQEALE